MKTFYKGINETDINLWALQLLQHKNWMKNKQFDQRKEKSRYIAIRISYCDTIYILRVLRYIDILWHPYWHLIQNVVTNVASMFTRTCWLFFNCCDVIKICGQLWSQEQPYMKFWASFPQIYGFQQAKPIRKLMLQIGLACWNWKI